MALPYFFSAINAEIVLMAAFFLIFLAFLVYVLSKVFRDRYGNVNKMTVGIISFCISFLIVYFGRNVFYNIMASLRISDTILYIISVILILILLYLFRRRLKLGSIIMLIGIGLILIGVLTDWFYQKVVVVVIGIVLLLIGAVVWAKKKPRIRSSRNPIERKREIKSRTGGFTRQELLRQKRHLKKEIERTKAIDGGALARAELKKVKRALRKT